MLAKTDRPHMTALTMDEKLSSRMTMSAASLETSVPAMPMARPTSDSFRAGASLVPSPVTATISPMPFSVRTRTSLSAGEERARTWRRGSRATSSASGRARKVGPSMDRPPSVKMPHSRAMCWAVWMLSPVTMRTVMPASWQVATAAGTSGRTGSLMPTMPIRVSPSSKGFSGAAPPGPSTEAGTSFWARQMVRRPVAAMPVTSSISASRAASSRGVGGAPPGA